MSKPTYYYIDVFILLLARNLNKNEERVSKFS